MRAFPLGFLAIIILEFWLVAIVATHVGAFLTLLLFVSTTFIGLSLLRSQASEIFAQTTGALQQRDAIKSLFSASKIMMGGVLLVVPGFLTDGLGMGLIVLGLIRRWQVGHGLAPQEKRYRDSPFRSEHEQPSPKDHEIIEGEFTRDEPKPRD